ncbi:MAG: thiamine-monophosphate kinase, partial [Thermoleophilia bacterium]|nr:thiamine-monophosphate kinase [Thermoleophilia bacterium]
MDETAALTQILAGAHRDNGDDATLLRVPGGVACISTDSTVEGVHAPLGTAVEALGRRAVARALSDLAAMGAVPVAVTCAVQVPPGRWADAVAAMGGARSVARERGCDVVGGDLTAL